MLEMAGEAGVSLADLRSLSPWEVQHLFRGYFRRRRRDREQAAEHASWVTSPHLRRPISALDILGETEPAPAAPRISASNYSSRESYIAAIRAARAAG